MSEEHKIEQTQEEPREEESKPAPSQHVVEVQWEELEHLVQLNSTLNETENYLAKLLLEMEKRKISILKRVQDLQTTLYSAGEQLRNAKGIDESHTYELKLPTSQGEKGYFIRKEP